MERSLATQRTKLIQARMHKHWTIERAASYIGVSAKTYSRWERGDVMPHASSMQLLCEAFGMTVEEFGFDQEIGAIHMPIQEPPEPSEAQFYLAYDPTMRLLSLAFLPLDLHTMQREVIKLLEEHSMNRDPISRREALRRLATLPMASLHLNAVTPTLSAPAQEVLAHCSAGIIACWYLRKGKELSFADSAVSAYIPTLKEIVTTSHHRKAAADLLVQCYLLKAVLSSHCTTPANGIGYARQAEQYSKIAGKPLLQVAALRVQASMHSSAHQWEQALQAGLQAKQIMETTPKDLIPPLAHSYVYAGLATYQAHQGHKQEALTSLKKAHTTFFARTEADTVPLWIDHCVGNLLLNDGLTHSQLGLYKGAVDSFGQVNKNYAQDTTVSFACRIETQIEQVLAEVSRGDQGRDMEKCITLWTQGITGAKEMQSNKHYTNALVAYTAMQAAWPTEGRIKALREQTAHW